ncbi:MAG: hypothetical protein LBD78_07215 [Spirochaetaceae bacterium]|jgi:hypothetical protein|nr:hypothetical protein [Spirochaetaceae bacterium]
MSVILCLVLACFLCLTGCTGSPEGIAVFEPPPLHVGKARDYQILDHKNKSVGQDLPEWVKQYLAEDIPGIEAMRRYEDAYVFVGVGSGTNRRALEQWLMGFTVFQDLPRMVAARIHARFAATTVNPDVVYGRYFEQVIKRASDIQYPGAEKQDDYWLLRRGEVGEEAPSGDLYDFYILVSIDKESLRKHINGVLEGIKTDTTREQAAAITRLRENFYNGF